MTHSREDVPIVLGDRFDPEPSLQSIGTMIRVYRRWLTAVGTPDEIRSRLLALGVLEGRVKDCQRSLRWSGTGRWTYILSVLGVTGAALNVGGSPWCWPLWTAANLGWLAWATRRRVWPQAIIWTCFLATSSWGWWRWIGG